MLNLYLKFLLKFRLVMLINVMLMRKTLVGPNANNSGGMKIFYWEWYFELL